MRTKILDRRELITQVQEIRRNDKSLVFTNGCFDILHIGHIHYLDKASQMGDYLVVAINSDLSVKKLKGRQRPVNNERDRMEIIAALEMVDFVTMFDETNCISIIKEVKPDIYVKGGDYTAETLPEWPAVAAYGGKLELINLVQERSTSDIIEKIKELENEVPAAGTEDPDF